MRTLEPGMALRIKRSSVALGDDAKWMPGDEVLDVSLLPRGLLVRFLKPSWLIVLLPDGNEVEVHVDSVEFTNE